MTTISAVPELVRPIARSIRWSPLVISGASGAIIVYLQARDACTLEGAGGSCVGLGARISIVRIAAVLIAIGAGFILDDPTEETTAHQPVSLLLRRFTRIAVAAPAVLTFWWLSMALAVRTLDDPASFPKGAVSVELAAIVAVALALAAVATPFVPERMGGIAAGPALLGFVVGLLLLPPRLNLFVNDPMHERWSGSHEAWWAILVLAALVLLLSSRDPWRRRLASVLRVGRTQPRKHREVADVHSPERNVELFPGRGENQIDQVDVRMRR
ncbi:ABC transporter [soil metagenome]